MIDSLLNQDYDNFEIILIDDSGNTKETSIPSYGDNKKIKVIRNKKNYGLTRSLNIGIEVSTGEYMARVDRGDWCYPDRLSQQIKFMRKHNIDICGSFVEEIDIYDRQLRIHKPPLKHENIVASLMRKNCLIHSSIIVKKATLIKLNMYDERLRYAQDYDLYLRAILKGCKFGVVDKVLLKHRVYNDSTTIKKRKQQILYANAALVCYYASTETINTRILLNIMSNISKVFIPTWLRAIKRRYYL